MTKVLAARDVHKRFGGVHAVRGVSIEVPEGRILGLIGPNGSGKSTLLNVMAGVEKPTAGSVFLGDERIDGFPVHRVVERGVAKTHQIPKPFLEMTTRENVAVAALYGAGKVGEPAEALRSADRVLNLVGLQASAEKTAASLTVQERKRLELARVLGTGARILLLDEIFAGLSAEEVRDAVRMLAGIQREIGFGALVVEHVMRAVLSLSDHVVVIDEGAKIAEGTPREVVADPAVVEAYLGAGAADASP